MPRTPLQTTAAGWCLVMAALLTVVQFSGLPDPPLALYLVFTGVWLFGAAMLWWFPTFGAIGTALYGALQASQILSMHGVTALNVVIALASLGGSAFAVAFFVQRRRAA